MIEPSPASGRPATHLVLPAYTLWHRELVRFFRQPHRVASAVASPLMLWAMLGFGLNDAFVIPGEDGELIQTGYAAYFFPGALTMTLLFTAVFSTITIIDDRKEGFLQAVTVAPVARFAIVIGKVLGGASIALIHGLIFLVLWPTIGSLPSLAGAAMALVAMLILSISLTAMGLCLAWRLDSSAGFHAVMMLFLMPMWFLSGAVFPISTAPPWLAAIMRANPLTYGHALLAAGLRDDPSALPVGLPATAAIALLATAGLLVAATLIVSRRRPDGTG